MVVIVCWLVHSLAYHFVTDDAYISFVYACNLAEHGELSFNLGQPVEGYSNFSSESRRRCSEGRARRARADAAELRASRCTPAS